MDYHKLEKRHFDYFVEVCGLWINYFGLLGWSIRYSFEPGDDDDPLAMLSVSDFYNRIGTITLYDLSDAYPSEESLAKTAFHEVVELLLSDLAYLAQTREWDYDEYDKESHRVIRTLEQCVFPVLKKVTNGAILQPDVERENFEG